MTFAGLSLRDLEYVVAVADCGSFVKAAEQCNVAQPSLSVQVSRLEGRLSTRIFERTTRRVMVTTEGRRLVEQMRLVLREAGILLEMAGDRGQPFGGALRLSAIATVGPYLFPRILRDLRGRYPDVSFILGEGRTAELLAALSRGELDAALVSVPLGEATLEMAPLYREPFLLATPDDYPPAKDAKDSKTPDRMWVQLAPEERLLLEEGHCLRDQALAACTEVDASNRHATSLETLKYMVAAGEGCTLIPSLAVSEIAGVRYHPLPVSDFSRTIGLVWRRSSPRASDLARLAAHIAALDLPGTLRAQGAPSAV